MNLIIFGIGDFAKLMQYYFELETSYKVVAFCVDKKYIKSDKYTGIPVVSYEKLAETFCVKDYHIFIAMGYKDMRARKNVYDKISILGYKLASFISKESSYDDSVEIGDNCIILQGSILEPFSKIESNCFINTGVTICHHAYIKKHTFIAARSVIGGYTIVGENSFLGFNSTVLQKLVLGNETLIAAGSVCINNTSKYSLYIGSPAKKVDTHEMYGIRIIDDNQ